MGTNFYFGTKRDFHIGKRSAAGPYCWDCGITLADEGEDKWENKSVYGTNAVHNSDTKFLDECPVCGNKLEKEGFSNSSVGRELGFNDNKPMAKEGVKSCSSFNWAIKPSLFQKLFKKYLFVYDEYGDKFTRKEFIEILKECPIKFYSSIGIEFF